MKRLAAAILVLTALGAAPIARAGDDRTLAVTVTSVSGRSVFIDKGRAAGVVEGMRVLLRPLVGFPVEGTVQAVASESARVELPAGAVLPPPGTPGEITLPEPASPPEGAEPAERDADAPPPEHPPWTRQEGTRAADAPLLAPAFGEAPKDRPMRIDGRIFSLIEITQDDGDGRDSNYFVGRLGTWLQVTNPFKIGGRFEFAGELDYRDADVPFDSDSEFQPILDIASYTLGGEFYSPYILQVGRFYPDNLPEIGVIDGAAGAVQLENGLRSGAGFGVYPRPFPDRDWGDDLSLHFFVDYNSKKPGFLSAILAYQHTWHNGDPDRDLLFGRVSMRPDKAWWFYCSWWLDIYTDSDPLKGPGVDLTQFWAQAQWTPTTTAGLSLSLSHTTWVETKRREYQDVPLSLIADGNVDRVDLSAWKNLDEDLKLTGTVGYWTDQDSDGFAGDFAVDWSESSGSWPAVHGEVFYTQGSFNDGGGLRVQVRDSFGPVSCYVGYELFAYTATTAGGTGDYTRNILQGGASWTTGHMTYSLDADYYFGDGEGAYSISLFAEYRF